MLKEELEAMIDRRVTVDQLNLVNHVYMYHPANFSKENIADLWKMGGQEIFNELTPSADKMCALEKNVRNLECQLNTEKKKVGQFKARYDKHAKA